MQRLMTAVIRDSTLVKRIITYFRPQAKRMAIISAVIVLTSLVNTGLPIFISSGLDNLKNDSSTGTLLKLTGRDCHTRCSGVDLQCHPPMAFGASDW